MVILCFYYKIHNRIHNLYVSNYLIVTVLKLVIANSFTCKLFFLGFFYCNAAQGAGGRGIYRGAGGLGGTGLGGTGLGGTGLSGLGLGGTGGYNAAAKAQKYGKYLKYPSLRCREPTQKSFSSLMLQC